MARGSFNNRCHRNSGGMKVAVGFNPLQHDKRQRTLQPSLTRRDNIVDDPFRGLKPTAKITLSLCDTACNERSRYKSRTDRTVIKGE